MKLMVFVFFVILHIIMFQLFAAEIQVPEHFKDKRVAVVILTYWTQAMGENDDQNKGAVGRRHFDHPTRLNHENDGLDIVRCLDSYLNVKGVSTWEGFAVDFIVVGVPNNPKLDAKVRAKLEDALSRYHGKLNIRVVSESDLPQIKSLLKRSGAKKNVINLVSMNGYSNARNLQLMLGMLGRYDKLLTESHLYRAHAGELAASSNLPYEAVISVDDDQIVAKDTYIMKSLEGLGTIYPGKIGIYLNKERTWRSANTEPEYFQISGWHKTALINRAQNTLFIGGIKPSHGLALGGNIIYSEEIYNQVFHDPNCIRREDQDMLQIGRIFGIDFYLDPSVDMAQIHLAPQKKSTLWMRHRIDVLSFLYSREKYLQYVKATGRESISSDQLELYPYAMFLDNGNLTFDQRARRSCSALSNYFRNLRIEAEENGDSKKALEYKIGEVEALETIKIYEREKKRLAKAHLVSLIADVRRNWTILSAALQGPKSRELMQTFSKREAIRYLCGSVFDR